MESGGLPPFRDQTAEGWGTHFSGGERVGHPPCLAFRRCALAGDRHRPCKTEPHSRGSLSTEKTMSADIFHALIAALTFAPARTILDIGKTGDGNVD